MVALPLELITTHTEKHTVVQMMKSDTLEISETLLQMLLEMDFTIDTIHQSSSMEMSTTSLEDQL